MTGNTYIGAYITGSLQQHNITEPVQADTHYEASDLLREKYGKHPDMLSKVPTVKRPKPLRKPRPEGRKQRRKMLSKRKGGYNV